MRFAPCLLLLGLAACVASEPPPTTQAELDATAAHVVALSTQAVSWSELRIHPALRMRPCSVQTLVNEEGQVVGYCTRGRQCRTNDWRPVLDGCEASGPAMTPAPAGSALEMAGRR
jgi:hypothetical protein